MQDSEHKTLATFRERLAEERQRLVLDEAQKGSLPAAGFVAHIADLDGTIAAVEAVIEENGKPKGEFLQL